MSTTEVGGIDVPTYDLRKAIEAVTDGDISADATRDDIEIHDDVAEVGSVLVHGDDHPDPDIHVVNTATKESSHLVSAVDAYDSAQSFTDYLETEVFSFGTYEIQSSDEDEANVRVAEFEDGSGYICPEDLERAVSDRNVELVTVFDGWLHLADNR